MMSLEKATIDICSFNFSKYNSLIFPKNGKSNSLSSSSRKRLIRANHLMEKLNCYVPPTDYSNDSTFLQCFEFIPADNKKEIVLPEPEIPYEKLIIEKVPEPEPPKIEFKPEPKKEEPIVPKENIEAKVVQEIKVDNNDNSYVEKMLAGGDNFKAIKSKIKEIIFDKNNEKAFGRIMDAFEPMISQVNEESTIQTTANKIIATLKEIKEAGKKDLYIGTIEHCLNLMINKSLSFVKETPYKIFNIIKVLNLLNSSTVNTLLFQKIYYYCPYVIPFQYTKDQIANPKELKERLGFKEDESIIEFNHRMENYEYLYFCFLFCNYEKYKPLIENYINQIEKKKATLALGNSLKVFFDVFGNKLSQVGLFDKLKSIGLRFCKELAEANKKSKNTDTKVTNSTTMFKIDRAIKAVTSGKMTTLYSKK